MRALLLALLGCNTPTPPVVQDPCALLQLSVPGPRASERAAAGDDALTIARLHVREARETGDPGFYTLADQALTCALQRRPDDLEAARLSVHVTLQFHRFAEAEARARKLAEAHGHWMDWMLLGDAVMEQGRLDEAAEAYQRAVDQRPGLELYDRIGWLYWLWGDLEGALEMQRLAVAAGTPRDPEPLAWVLTRLGWLNALQGRPAPEIETALGLLPDYKPARFARGRIRLAAGDMAGAAEDLRAAGRTVEAAWALQETGLATSADPSPATLRSQDPRGYACWLADQDPVEAVRVLEEELKTRQDAVTRIAHGYARSRAGQDGAAEIREALATGIAEPRSLFQAGVVLGDQALLARAASMGPGLLPSELAKTRGP